MTEEQKRISKKNWTIAANYFNLQKGYVLHHIDAELKHTNIERYILWLPEDLVVLSKRDHISLHWQLDHDERARKIGEANKGKHRSDECKANLSKNRKEYFLTHDNPFKGKHHSDETKKKISQANMGNTPFKGKTHSDDTKRKISELAKERLSVPQNHPMYGKECPNKGKKYYNNGVEQVLAFECPVGYVKGRLRKAV